MSLLFLTTPRKGQTSTIYTVRTGLKLFTNRQACDGVVIVGPAIDKARFAVARVTVNVQIEVRTVSATEVGA